MKKIIINENQFKLIESLILENKFKTNDIIKSDIIIIHKESGSDLKFEVMGNLPEGIFMRVLDKNSNDRNKLIQFSFLNLSKELLTLKYTVKSEKEKLEGQLDWKNMSIKEIKAVSIYNDNKQLKDKIDFNEEGYQDNEDEDNSSSNNDNNDDNNDGKSEEEYYNEALGSLVNELDDLIKGKQYVFNLKDGSDLFFTVIDKKPSALLLNLDKTNGGESSRYKDLIDSEITFEVDESNIDFNESKPDSNDTVEYLFNIKVSVKDSEGDSEDVVIKGITDYDESNENETDVKELSDEDVVDLIMNDPNVRSAFMKKPTFFDLITNKSPKGINKAREILSKFNKNKTTKDVKNNEESVTKIFKQHETLKLEVLDNAFSKTVNQERYNLLLGEKYSGKVKNKRKNKVIVKVNNLIISINSVRDSEKNEYNCKVIIPIKDGDNIIDNRVIKIIKQY